MSTTTPTASLVSAIGTINPCITCGACCAFFRASFYWTEADPVTGGLVPQELTIQLTPYLAVMKGTEGTQPRCVCLQGTIGEFVHCAIYPLRSSVCRDFPFSWQDGTANERCDKARIAWGLPPLASPITPQLPDNTRAA
jgi:Fe-S-cluster containining protein